MRIARAATSKADRGRLAETAFVTSTYESCGPQLREACEKLSSEMREALSAMRERVAQDKLPLLSLLQVEPLKMQSSHLSFQEYFAARAMIKSGSMLSGSPPWQWPGMYFLLLTSYFLLLTSNFLLLTVASVVVERGHHWRRDGRGFWQGAAARCRCNGPFHHLRSPSLTFAHLLSPSLSP